MSRGHSGDESELWVERAAGVLRKVTRNRTTMQAEQAMMKGMLDQAALNRFTDRHNVVEFSELCPDYGRRVLLNIQ